MGAYQPPNSVEEEIFKHYTLYEHSNKNFKQTRVSNLRSSNRWLSTHRVLSSRHDEYNSKSAIIHRQSSTDNTRRIPIVCVRPTPSSHLHPQHRALLWWTVGNPTRRWRTNSLQRRISHLQYDRTRKNGSEIIWILI